MFNIHRSSAWALILLTLMFGLGACNKPLDPKNAPSANPGANAGAAAASTATMAGAQPGAAQPASDPKPADASQQAKAGGCATCGDAKAVQQLPAEVPAGQVRTSFLVPDMCCPGKAGRITKALLVLEGVSGCAADAAKTTVTVDYDPQALQPKAIIAAIKGAGFEATEVVLPS